MHKIFYCYTRIHSTYKVFLTKFSEKFLTFPTSSDPLGEATQVLFLHRIAESVSSDIPIDFGGTVSEHQSITFQTVFSVLKLTRIFKLIIEHTLYSLTLLLLTRELQAALILAHIGVI